MSAHRNTASEKRRKRAFNREKGYWAARERMWKKYGIKTETDDGSGLRDFTRLDYLALLNYQEGHDPLCGTDDFWGSLAVEHDHTTGLARGLCCHKCNQRAIGTFERYGHYKGVEHEAALAKYLGDPPYQRMMRGAPFVPYWTPKRAVSGKVER